MEKPNRIEYKVYGRYALFTDPITKTGGEKFTYPVPTYQALKGITESLYWKPTLTWIIEKVRIMNIIQTQPQGIRPIHYQDEKNDLSVYTYLKNVEYQVQARFVWNEHRPDLVHDRNENKHHEIARRMVKRGGRRDVFLGTRECQGYVEPCVFGEENGHYDKQNMSFGMMLHGITYPDEAYDEATKGKMTARFWNPVMEDGVITFKQPEECEWQRTVGEFTMKQFDHSNFSGLAEFAGGGAFGDMD
ncbi:MAG: type I-C CRISPR-associated protein Cas5c [Lachnospiraceae bacterium]|nr:type I-C CRISPR-associated protein Cas5c [Lachnospiraceae bacterium]